MTVNNVTSKISYAGNGSTTVFTFPFPGEAPEAIQVFITNALGDITHVSTSQYTVTLNSPVDPNPTSVGGQIVYPLSGAPLATGNTLTIVRLIPILQPTTIANQSIIYPPIVEQEFDYLVMIDQQLSEMIDRSVKVGIADPPMPPLPPVEFRKNTQAVFDANGNMTAGGAVVGTIISAAMIPVVTAPTLPQARIAMGVASLDSPVFIGDPTAPTPPPLDNDKSIATTEWIQNFVSINGGGFPSGTRTVFQQTTAPAGWTKDTTHNDKALRVVNSTVGTGGSVAFSTAFGSATTGATTLTTAQIPLHSHTITDPTHVHDFVPAGLQACLYNGYTAVNFGGDAQVYTGGFASPVINHSTGITIGNNPGGGGSHSHPQDLRVMYVDLIIAQKD